MDERSNRDFVKDRAFLPPQQAESSDPSASTTMLLVRATELDARVLQFADSLAVASRCEVAFVTDERQGPTPPCGRPITGVSDAACEALGLYCPPAFAWQCGDYGYYVARDRYPRATHFWLIEYDVRFGGRDPAAFFAFFAARPEIDLLAPYLGPAGWEWFWAATARGCDVRPMQCLFPVTRLSSRAIDALLAKRVAHSRRALRRALWPNDEAMVATTLLHGDFVCRDFNEFGALYYSESTFSFTQPINGDTFEPDASQTQIYHPVLFGDQYTRKKKRLQEVTTPPPYLHEKWKRFVAKANSRTLW